MAETIQTARAVATARATTTTRKTSAAGAAARAIGDGLTTRPNVLTLTVEREQARVRIELSGGSPGHVLYVLRRDSGGTGMVRETSEGTVVWPDSGTLTLYDYEPQQGEDAEYIVTDQNGVGISSARISVPQWGTWVKSPGRPYRNVRVFYQGESGGTAMEARRMIVPVQSSPHRVVFAQTRLSEQGALQLLTRTAAQAEALQLLLADGMPLMLDVPASWGVPYRYISVGDVTVARAHDLEGLNLTHEARIWELADVVTIEMPQGVSTLDPTRTYAELSTQYATYVAIPALVGTYEQLGTGEGL